MGKVTIQNGQLKIHYSKLVIMLVYVGEQMLMIKKKILSALKSVYLMIMEELQNFQMLTWYLMVIVLGLFVNGILT